MGRPDWSRPPELLPDAARFTRGNPAHLGLYILDGALDYLAGFGAPAIEGHVQALTTAMLARLEAAGIASTTPADPRRHGASVCVQSPHAAAIVAHLQRMVGVEDHLHRAGVAGQGFVDTVVDHFLGQVIGPTGVGVHARPLADRIKAREDFDGVCVVGASAGIGHGFSSSVW